MIYFRHLLLLLAFFIAPYSATAEPQKLVIAADEWCPYNCVPGSKKPGYMVEIARAALANSAPGKYQVIYQQMPWKRAMLSAQQGKIDGIIGAIASEAEGLHLPDNEQGLMFAKLFVLADNPWRFSDTHALAMDEIRLGAIDGYDYEASIAQFIEEYPELVYLSTGETALPKLIELLNLGRIDSLIEDESVFWFNVSLAGFPAKNYKPAGAIEQPQKLYLAFHEPNVAKLLDQGMQNIRKNGQLAKILERYGLIDWRQP